MAKKPSIPKGTRDFSPTEVARRNYIIQTIKKHFEIYGFQPIETPSFENSDTLMGKYGEEGDRLIFKILESGDYFKSVKGLFLDKTITDIWAIAEYTKALNLTFSELIKYTVSKYFLLDEYLDLQNLENKVEVFSNLKNQFTKLLFNNLSNREDISDSLDINELLKLIDIEGIINYYWEYFNSLTRDFQGSEIISFSEEKQSSIINFSNTIFEVFFNRELKLINPKIKNLTNDISEKALRYDLTVPFARYVVMHQNELDFPFKRYQIQPVWRADRPQKGRFREFYQCDADVVGSNSLLQEVELVQLYDAVFTDLKLEGSTIKLNNRKILSGIAEVIGAKHLLVDFTVALDKLDKIGEEKVKEEMQAKGISEAAIAKAAPLFAMSGSSLEQLAQLKSLLVESEVGMNGIAELEEIINTVEEIGLNTANLQVDVTLARGLNYYTGAIFEVSAPKGVLMGSIGGGGRYDDLTGIFGLKDVSGIGISFGLDRIYLVLEELGLFPERLDQSIDVLCINFGEKEGLASLKLVGKLREKGIKAEVYPTSTKMQKQMKYANNRKVPYVVLIGEQELSNQEFVVKNMDTGQQETYSLNKPEAFVLSLRA